MAHSSVSTCSKAVTKVGQREMGLREILGVELTRLGDYQDVGSHREKLQGTSNELF